MCSVILHSPWFAPIAVPSNSAANMRTMRVVRMVPSEWNEAKERHEMFCTRH
jgi:hypothetical protein